MSFETLLHGDRDEYPDTGILHRYNNPENPTVARFFDADDNTNSRWIQISTDYMLPVEEIR